MWYQVRSSSEDVADGFEVSLEVFGVGQVLEGAVEELFAAEAEQPGEGVVDAEPASVGCDHRHSDRGAVEGSTEAFLALLESPLCR